MPHHVPGTGDLAVNIPDIVPILLGLRDNELRGTKRLITVVINASRCGLFYKHLERYNSGFSRTLFYIWWGLSRLPAVGGMGSPDLP